MKYMPLLLIVFTTLLTGCPPGKKDTPAAAKYCFLYCDFTNSMDSAAHEKVISDALTIYDSLNISYEMYFYSIGAASFKNVLIISRPQLVGLMTDIQRSKSIAQKNHFRDSLENTLRAAWYTKQSGGTCIIDAIKNSIDELTSINRDTSVSRRLFFLSDMKECCNGINLEKGLYEQAEKNPVYVDPANSFSKYQDIEIAAVMSASGKTDADKHKKFWTNIFSQFGHKKIVMMTQNIPAWMLVK